MKSEFKNLGVVGLGVMGFDIAFLYAMKGFRTTAYDAAPAAMNAVENRREETIEHRSDAFLRSSLLLRRLAMTNPRFYVDQKANPKIYDLVEVERQRIADAAVKQALRTATLVAAARVAELGESPTTIDFVAQEGLKLPEAPLKEIDTVGASKVLEQLAAINQQLGGEPLTAPELLTEMAKANQTFYKNDQANPWLSAYLHRSANHARH